MPISEEPAASPRRGGGDPLGAMYVLAALLFAGAALIIVILMFVARNGTSTGSGSDVYTPGSSTAWTPPRALEAREAAGVTQTSPGHYLAVVEARNWQFYPEEIRVPVGSEVTFRVRSVEDYHGFSIVGTPVLIALEQNAFKEVTQSFPVAGVFPIQCSQYCGAGHASMTGRVVVVANEAHGADAEEH